VYRKPHPHNRSPGEAIYDPFIGSGTTLIAAQTTGRICLGLELDPAYVDVAVRRWMAFNGEKCGSARGWPFVRRDRS
jgi:DNA modification methylase